MTSLKRLGLAAIVASTLATPAFAQTTVDNSGRCTGLFQDPNCQESTRPAIPPPIAPLGAGTWPAAK